MGGVVRVQRRRVEKTEVERVSYLPVDFGGRVGDLGRNPVGWLSRRIHSEKMVVSRKK